MPIELTADSRDPLAVESRHIAALASICLAIKPTLSFRELLQTVVDAVGDQTDWGLCFVYVLDANQEIGEVAARRDRIEYAIHAPLRRWEADGTPALEAIRKHDVVAIADASAAIEYPRFVEATRRLGAVCAVYLPLDVQDQLGRPMLLCVQSRKPLLGDESQIPFLRAVAAVLTMAADSARARDEARAESSRESAFAGLLRSTIAGAMHGESVATLLAAVEHRTNQPLLVLGHMETPLYCGRSPLAVVSDAEWGEAARRGSEAIAAASEASFDVVGSRQAVPVELVLPGLPAPARALASVLPTEKRRSGLVVTFPLGEDGIEAHNSAATAVAVALLKDRLAFEAKQELQHSVVARLLGGDFSDAFEAITVGGYVGLDFTRVSTLIVLRPSAAASTVRMSDVVRASIRRHDGALLDYVNECFVILLAGIGPRDSTALQLAQSLERTFTGPGGECEAIITLSDGCTSPETYPSAWARCLQTIENAEIVAKHGIVTGDEFGALRLLLPGMDRDAIREFIDQTVGPLVCHDASHGSSLFETAESFAGQGGRFESTARALFIHVSTLRYRLQRIEKLLGRSLAEDEVRFEIQLAARLERLRHRPGRPAGVEESPADDIQDVAAAPS